MSSNKSFVDLVMHYHYFIIEKSLPMMYIVQIAMCKG